MIATCKICGSKYICSNRTDVSYKNSSVACDGVTQGEQIETLERNYYYNSEEDGYHIPYEMDKNFEVRITPRRAEGSRRRANKIGYMGN